MVCGPTSMPRVMLMKLSETGQAVRGCVIGWHNGNRWLIALRRHLSILQRSGRDVVPKQTVFFVTAVFMFSGHFANITSSARCGLLLQMSLVAWSYVQYISDLHKSDWNDLEPIWDIGSYGPKELCIRQVGGADFPFPLKKALLRCLWAIEVHRILCVVLCYCVSSSNTTPENSSIFSIIWMC